MTTKSRITAVTLGLIHSYVWDGVGIARKDFLKTSMSITVDLDDKDPKVVGHDVVIRFQWMGRQLDNWTDQDITGEFRASSGQVILSTSLEDQFNHVGFTIARELERTLTEWCISEGLDVTTWMGMIETNFKRGLNGDGDGFEVQVKNQTGYPEVKATGVIIRIEVFWPREHNGHADLATYREVTWTDWCLYHLDRQRFFRDLGRNVNEQMWGAVNGQEE